MICVGRAAGRPGPAAGRAGAAAMPRAGRRGGHSRAAAARAGCLLRARRGTRGRRGGGVCQCGQMASECFAVDLRRRRRRAFCQLRRVEVRVPQQIKCLVEATDEFAAGVNRTTC